MWLMAEWSKKTQTTKKYKGGIMERCEEFVVAKLDFEKNILSVKTISFESIL